MSYLVNVLRLLAATPPRQGVVAIVDVHHEDGCSFFLTGVCDCSPAVSMVAPIDTAKYRGEKNFRARGVVA